MIKKILSWAIAIPALIIFCSEFESVNLEWIRLLAMLILIGVAFWNHAFDEEQFRN